MRNTVGLFVCAALLLAGCASETGSTPSSIAGTWVFQVLSSGCPQVVGIANGDDGLQPEVFEVFQSGDQVSASFTDNGGFNCSFDGTYRPDELRGTLTITDGFRTLEASLEGFARDFGGQVQVDGWARINQDTDGECEGAIIEFCAKVGGQPPVNNPPQVSFSGAGSTIDICVVEGTVVDIEYTDNDDGNASTSMFADRDGDILTTDDQIVIFAGRSDGNGQSQTAMWDTTDVPAAEYTIIVVTTDGQFTDTDTRVGTVTVICDKPVDLDFARGVDATIAVDGTSIAGFDDGSFVVTGIFAGTAVFGVGDPNETTLVSEGGEDIFIARYNADGTIAWARRAGGPLDDFPGDQGRGVATFADGSSVIVGRFNQTVNFGLGQPNETILNGNLTDAFVARYDAAGMLIWATSGTGDSAQDANAVTSFADGSMVVVGEFREDMTLGVGEPNETTLINSTTIDSGNERDVFVARFDSDGMLVWARSAGGPGRDVGETVAGFADGSIVIAGTLNDTMDIGTETFTTAGDDDFFVARFDANGNVVWARTGGGPEQDLAAGATALLDGSAVVTGFLTGTIQVGPGDPDEVTLSGVDGSKDVLLMRFGPDGAILWARGDGGPNTDDGQGIASFPDGSTIVTGEAEDATFGAGEANETTFVSRGSDDIYYAHYDVNGMLIWACRDGGADDDEGRAVATFPDGSFVVAGDADGAATYGKGDPNETTFADQLPIVRYSGAPVGPPLQPTGGLTDQEIIAACGDITLVFIIDTSASMADDAAALDLAITGLVSQLEGFGATVSFDVLGITETGAQAVTRINNMFSAVQTLLNMFGIPITVPLLPPTTFANVTQTVTTIRADVPLRGAFTTPPITFANPIDSAPPKTIVPGVSFNFSFESWASAVAMVAEDYGFRTGTVPIIIPISDECAEEGLSGEFFSAVGNGAPGVLLADRGDCDQGDVDATSNAILLAQEQGAIVSPIQGFLFDTLSMVLGQPAVGFHPDVASDMDRLANATGGQRFTITDPATEMAGTLFDLVVEACRGRVDD